MRFLPVFMDVTSGPVALAGAGEHAVNKLRLLLAAHATVRWYPGHTDVADEIVQAAAGPGKLEVDFHDPLSADFAGCDRGRERDRRWARREDFRARPRRRHSGERGRSRRPLHLRVSGHRRSRRRGRGDRHQRSCAGAGAAAARAHRGDRARAHRRSRHADGPLSPPRRRGQLHSPRLFWQKVVDGPIGAAVLAGRYARAEADLVRSIDNAGGRDPRSVRPAPCSWSAPAPAIPTC